MLDFRFPAEWEKQQSLWTAFPFDADEWHAQLTTAQQEIAQFVATLVNHGQKTKLLCRDEAIKALAQEQLNPLVHEIGDLEYIIMAYGDIWLRDTGPITITNSQERRALSFGFNGWGNKFLMDGDQEIAQHIARHQNLPFVENSMIFEGGAIDVDGIGNAVTTQQCVLNPNRNPNMTKDEIETILCQELGINTILWLGDGLIGDHTDGHVDNLARFIGPKHLLVPKAQDNDDPNLQIYEDAADRAVKFGYEVSRIISAGLYEIDGEIAPASYMNFVIANDIIIVPQFNISSDKEAVETISALFPNRKIIGLASIALLSGGGSFHCSSQQVTAIR